MMVGCTTTYAISAYHHKRCEFESRSWRGVPITTLCDQVCQWLADFLRVFLEKQTAVIKLKYCWKWR